jgi:hypothetical protein
LLAAPKPSSQPVTRPFVEVYVAHSTGLLGFEKINHDIGGTHHAATLANPPPLCNHRMPRTAEFLRIFSVAFVEMPSILRSRGAPW